jgi:hypothetical protein
MAAVVQWSREGAPDNPRGWLIHVASRRMRSKVLVCEGRHGGIGIEYRGRALGWNQIAAPLKPAPRAEAVGARVPVAIAKRKWVPPANHPWHEPARRTVQQKELRGPEHRWLGPALRPKRSALRAPQDSAPVQANGSKRNRDVPGRAQRESSLLAPLDAKFLKRKSAEAEKARRQQTQNTKRGRF